MPQYQFQCNTCCTVEDVLRSFAAAGDPHTCVCGSQAFRIFGAAQIRTSNTFQRGVKLSGAQFGPGTREFYLDAAREAGVNPEGKVYDHRIAAFAGDPEAWVSSADEVRSLLEKRNWGCDGDLKVKCEPVAPQEDIRLADDLMEDAVELILEEKLGADFTDAKGPVVERAIEDVMNKHAPLY